jgi:hypothetical protein
MISVCNHQVAAQSTFMTVKLGVAHAHVQKLFSAVKMATMLEECITEEKRPVVHICGQKGSIQKLSHKEIFPVYGGKGFSRKAGPKYVRNISLMTRLTWRRGRG